MLYFKKDVSSYSPLLCRNSRDFSIGHLLIGPDECMLRPKLGLLGPNHLQKPLSMHGPDCPNWESRSRGSQRLTNVKFGTLSMMTCFERHVGQPRYGMHSLPLLPARSLGHVAGNDEMENLTIIYVHGIGEGVNSRLQLCHGLYVI